MAYQSEVEKLEQRFREKPEQWFAALADAYRKNGDLDLALDVLTTWIEKRPTYTSGHIVQGRCLIDKGNDSEAATTFERVLELDPENIIALKSLAEIAQRQGNVGSARSWLTRLIEVDPMNDEAEEALEALGGAEVAAESPSAPSPVLVPVEPEAVEDAGAPIGFEPTVPESAESASEEPSMEETPVVEEPAAAEPEPMELEPVVAAGFGGDAGGDAGDEVDDVVEIDVPSDSEADVVEIESTDDMEVPTAMESEPEPWRPPTPADAGVTLGLAGAPAGAVPDVDEELDEPDDVIEIERIDEPEEMVLSEPTSRELMVEHDDVGEIVGGRASHADVDLDETVAPAPGAAVEEPVMITPDPVPEVEPEPEPAPVAAAAPPPLDLIMPESSAPEDEGEPEPIVTQTMADLHVTQGLYDEARDMYRQLLERDPHNTALKSKLADLEEKMRAPAPKTGARYSVAVTGGESAREFLKGIAAASPGGEQGPRTPKPRVKQPAMPARGGGGGGADASVPGASFDQFFGSPAPETPPPSDESGGSPKKGDDQAFQSWLRDLKT